MTLPQIKRSLKPRTTFREVKPESFRPRRPRSTRKGAMSPGPLGSENSSSPARVPPTAGRRILVVDDDRDTAESFALLLRTLGHHAEFLTDPAHVPARVRVVRPHLVLLDIGMPGVDGWDLARLIRGDLGDSVQIVALTAYVDADARRRSREAGFDAHLPKPVDIQVLTRILDQMSER
ncbi:MAG: response regulator [Betaproteobacteria bacterium]|nr:response regulator [Betaproteobacteria bacterium]